MVEAASLPSMRDQNPPTGRAEQPVASAFDPERDGYFERDADRYLPTRHGAGPWAPGSISGRPVLGLCAHLFEQALPNEQWLPARLTVDLVRMAMMEPIEVSVQVRKSGRTALVLDIELMQSGRPVALARGLATLAEVTPQTHVWSSGSDIRPVPTEFLPEHPDYPMAMSAGRWIDGRGTYGKGPYQWLTPPEGPGVAWAWERGNLLAGEPNTPYVRLGLVADVSNPLINVGAAGLAFINADVSLYLSRRPEGRFIGLQALDHQHAQGTSVGAAALFDEAGPIGSVAMVSTHQPHLPTIVFNDPNSPAATRGV